MIEKDQSKIDRVLGIYASGILQTNDISTPELAESAGLTIKSLKRIRQALREDGYYPPFDPEAKIIFTEQHRAKISESLSWVWEKIRPYISRDGLPTEIETITGVSRQTITEYTYSHKDELSKLDYHSPEKRKSRKRRAGVLAAKKRLGKEMNPNELRDVEFVKQLDVNKLIPTNLRARKLIESLRVNWLDNFYRGLINEAFVAACWAQSQGAPERMRAYVRVGENFSYDWFYSREQVALRDSITGEVLRAISSSEKMQGMPMEAALRYVNS